MVLIFLFLIALIIFVIYLGRYLGSPETRGKIGEYNVELIIGETIENEQYVINDLILTNEGMTSQIDHIVINSRGVFVIETKNYSGRIYGSESQREWTQVLSYGKVKNKFYNPLKQNATHIYNVKRIIGTLPIYSLVVFVQNNTEFIDAKNVIPLSELRYVLQNGKDVLSDQQMKTAYEALLSNKVDISTEEHIYNIRKQQSDLYQGICPRCGGRLVLRKGKYGEFWGCSNYPKCKFKKND